MASRIPPRTDQDTVGSVPASTAHEIESLEIGNGGWVRHRGPNGATTTYLRFEDINGRLTCVELYFSDGVSPNVLRRVNLVDLENWVNDDGIRDAVRATLGVAGPLLRVAASHFGTTWGQAPNSPRRRASRPPNWAEQMFWSQYPGSGVVAVKQRPIRGLAHHKPVHVEAALENPATTPYPLAFYQQVATVYQNLVGAGFKDPNQRIADANHVGVSAVQGWVRRAREKGLLPPAKHGSRG